MKKSEIRLIIVGIASLVISVLLAVFTVIAFITDVTRATDFSKIEEGFSSLRTTIDEMNDDLREMRDIDVDVSIPEIDPSEVASVMNELDEITS